MDRHRRQLLPEEPRRPQKQGPDGPSLGAGLCSAAGRLVSAPGHRLAQAQHHFLLSKSERYYFDNDAIRESFKTPARSGERRSYKPGCASSFDLTDGHLSQKGNFAGLPLNPLGRNKRDVWTVPSSSFQGAHFAVFPEKLVEPCVLAGSPEGGVVLDPFMGSRTTGATAKRLGRSFIGIDIFPDYCAMAAKRLLDIKGAV